VCAHAHWHTGSLTGTRGKAGVSSTPPRHEIAHHRMSIHTYPHARLLTSQTSSIMPATPCTCTLNPDPLASIMRGLRVRAPPACARFAVAVYAAGGMLFFWPMKRSSKLYGDVKSSVSRRYGRQREELFASEPYAVAKRTQHILLLGVLP